MLSAFLLAMGMLCIYLTLNHQIIAPQYITVVPQYITVAPQYITVVPHPTAIAALYGTASFQYEAAFSDLGTNVDLYYWLVYDCQSN